VLLKKLLTLAEAASAPNSNLETLMADLTALTAAVTQNTTVEASAVTLIQGLAAQISANLTDPVALASLTNQLNTSATALAAAITANTPTTATPVTPAPVTPVAPAAPVVPPTVPPAAPVAAT
jgi:hypothetical protein